MSASALVHAVQGSLGLTLEKAQSISHSVQQNGIHKVHNHTSSTCKLALSKRTAFVQPKIHEPVGVVRNPG
jgi:hypothetical protein